MTQKNTAIGKCQQRLNKQNRKNTGNGKESGADTVCVMKFSVLPATRHDYLLCPPFCAFFSAYGVVFRVYHLFPILDLHHYSIEAEVTQAFFYAFVTSSPHAFAYASSAVF